MQPFDIRSHGPQFCLYLFVTAIDVIDATDDRLSFTKMSGYRPIEDEGDGLKSYVSICIALLLGLRTVPTFCVACCSRPSILRSFACQEPVTNFMPTAFPPTSSR